MPTAALAARVAAIAFADLPAEVVAKAKLCVLDTLGCAVAGAPHPVVASLRRAVDPVPVPPARAGASAWATGIRTGVATAALLNGTMSHVANADDAHKESMGHPATVVVPAAFAVAEMVGASGRTLLEAVVAGYECLLRVGLGIGIASHRARGWYSTSSLGPFGAATAASRLLGLDASGIAAALGHAGMQAGGLWAFSADESLGSMLCAGRAAEAGVLAALLARDGFAGPTRILDAPDGGFLQAMSDASDPAAVTADRGGRFMIMDVSLKPYPTSRTTHAAIDACLAIRGRLAARRDWLERVSRVAIHTYAVGKRQADIPAPATGWMASLSLQYTAAVALLEGAVGLEHFTPWALESTAVRELMKKITVVADDDLTAAFPARWSCRVEVTGAGIREAERVESALGDPRNPMSADQVREKFHRLTADALDPAVADGICAYVERLEQEVDITALAAMLCREHKRSSQHGRARGADGRPTPGARRETAAGPGEAPPGKRARVSTGHEGAAG